MGNVRGERADTEQNDDELIQLLTQLLSFVVLYTGDSSRREGRLVQRKLIVTRAPPCELL